MEIVDEGSAEIISKIDAEEHRRYVRDKSRALDDKITSAKDAVTKFVKDGSYVLFGFFSARVPMSIVYEIVRQRKKNIKVGRGGLFDLDILISSGCANQLDRGYGGGFETLGLSASFRRAIANKQLKIVEWSNTAFAWRLKAGAMGIPFIPTRTLMGTDTFKYSAAKVIKCPYTGVRICLVPACNPDVTMVHVDRCDKYGNAQIDGITGFDIEAAKASRRLIITAEEIIEHEKIRNEPWKTSIPYFYVDAVIEVPWGSHPSNMPGKYYMDEEFLSEYVQQSKTPEGVESFLNKYVYGANDFEEYLEVIGGIKKLRHLREVELLRSSTE